MKRYHSVRFAIPVALAAIAMIILAGCPAAVTVHLEQWDHVIGATEFTDQTTYMEYEYIDPRFNDDDYFDMHMVSVDGISDFDSVYDEISPSSFLYQPTYSNGSVTWFAHPGADALLAGGTLRFYRFSD